MVLYSNLKFRWGLAPSSPPPPPPCWASRCSWRSPWSLRQFLKPPSIFPSNICMSFNLRYYFSVSDNKQRNYNSMSGPPSKFVVVRSTLADKQNWSSPSPSMCMWEWNCDMATALTAPRQGRGQHQYSGNFSEICKVQILIGGTQQPFWVWYEGMYLM